MATNIKLKSSSLAGKTPTLSDLSLRELAVNTADGKLFLRRGDGSASDKIIDVTAPLQASEPMGHEDKSQSTISFNASTRVFTIQPASTSFNVWVKGVKYNFTTSQTVTIPNTTGLHYIFFNSNGVLSTKTTVFDWENEAPTAYVYWNATAGTAPFVADERHGITLDWATHEYLHRTRGAVIANGFSLSNFTTTGTGSNNTDSQFDLANGTFFDEDLEVDITHSNNPTADTWQQDLQGPARIPVFYLSGTGWVRDNPTDYALKQGTARIQYNLLNAGTWSTVDVPSNTHYTTSWIIATNNINFPVLAIMGQSTSNKISDQESISFSDLTLTNFPVVEFRPLWKIIWQTDATYANTPKARIAGVYDIRQLSSVGIGGVAVSDHGLLTGLTDDDHLQYLHTNITRTGVTAEFNTTGKITTTNRIGIGTTLPGNPLHILEGNRNIRIGDITTGVSTTDAGLVFTGSETLNTTFTSAIFTEVDSAILSYGINCHQIVSPRDTTRVGGIFRLDTRTTGGFGDSQCFVIKGQPVGLGTTNSAGGGEFNVFVADLDNGNTVLTPAKGNVGIGTTNPTTKLELIGVLGFGSSLNVRIGNNNTGSSLTSNATNNFFYGDNAGKSTTDGSYNIFMGSYSGYNNTVGNNNIFLGRESGFSNTSGVRNNFFGIFSGYSNTTGSDNNFFGDNAGVNNSTGQGNNCIGASAGVYTTTGSFNNCIGLAAGLNNNTGGRNNYIGSYTGISTTASNKIIIGSGFNTANLFDAPKTNTDTQFAVGIRTDANPSKYWLVGDENFNIGIGTTNPTQKLHVEGSAFISGTLGAAALSTGAAGTGININNAGTITGPATIVLDPAAIGDDTGTVSIKGNLEVLGTTTTINSTTLTVTDKNIVLANGVSTLANLDTAGIDFGSTAVRLRYNWNGGTNSGLSIEGARVGIGTTIPQGSLHIYRRDTDAGFGEVHADFILENPGQGNARFFLKTATNNRNWEFFADDNDGAFGIFDGVASARRFTILPNGNIGMGTTAPTVPLDVFGSSAQVRIRDSAVDVRILPLSASSAGIIGTWSNHDLVLHANNTEIARFRPSGNVGIGTTDPTSKLTVVGTTDSTVFRSSNGNAQSLTDGAAVFTGVSGAIVLDDAGHKRISWNDAGGNFNIRGGHYHNGTTIVHTKGSLDGIGGAATITLNTDGIDGQITMAVAPAANPGTAITWANSITILHTHSFTGLPIVTGTSALTGTAGQNLQVTGGAYVSGNVGIGTTNPQVPLHIRGGSSEGIIIQRASADDSLIRYMNTSGSMYAGLSSNATYWAIDTDNNLSTSPYFVVTNSTGNVGIGLTNPSAKLHVLGQAFVSTGGKAGTNTYLSLRSTDANSMELQFGNLTNTAWQIQSIENGVSYRALALNPIAGNVGIGTTNPTTTLDVRGTVNVAANLTGQDALFLNNNNILGVNNLRFADPGPYEGIIWDGGNGWNIFESPNDLVTNAPGNLQFTTGTTRRATLDTTGKLQVLGGIDSDAPIREKVGSTYHNVVTQFDIGFNANQIPLNQYLGQLAFLDQYSPSGLRRDGGGSDDLSVDSNGNVIFANNAYFGDNDRLYFGTGNDLEIYHSGTESIISDIGDGPLYIRGANSILLQHPSNGEFYAKFNENSSVELYHDNSKKLETTSNGVSITGTVTVGTYATSQSVTSVSTGTATGLAGLTIPISQVSATSYRSVEYIIQAVQTNNHQVTKLLLVHDGTNAYITEYGTIQTNAAVATYSADISGGNIVLFATTLSANSTSFKVHFTAINL